MKQFPYNEIIEFLLGLLLIPFGDWLSEMVKVIFYQTASNDVEHAYSLALTTRQWAVIITVAGIVLADYTSDALQHPCRAYLLDVCRIGIIIIIIIIFFLQKWPDHPVICQY